MSYYDYDYECEHHTRPLGYGDPWSEIEDSVLRLLQHKGARPEPTDSDGESKIAPEAETKRFYREARKKSLSERQWLAVTSLERLLARPLPGDRYAAEFCVEELGQDVGLQLLNANRKEDDELADGVARGWDGRANRLFERLREFPREDVRKRLCCLVPAHHPEGMPLTRLDARLSGDSALEHFDTRCLSSLVCDRSREVRRLARLARRLTCCVPGTTASYYDASLRRLERRANWRRQWFGGPPQIRPQESSKTVAAAVDVVCDQILECSDKGTPPPLEVVSSAISLAADAGTSPSEVDAVECALVKCRVIEWGTLIATPALARIDDHFALELLSRLDAPLALRRAFAVRALWSDEIAGELAESPGAALSDPLLRMTLVSCDWPHVLYALAMRGVHEVAEKAFRCLVLIDVDRAAKLAYAFAPNNIRITQSRWREALERLAPRDRSRLRELLPCVYIVE